MVTTKLNLSMTEPQVRQIYAKQGDTGRVLDISLDQTPEDGTLRILRPDGVEVTSEAVTGGEVESGSTFESLTEADVTELTVGIEPVQDLNGYDKPWVGGAGKNKLQVTSSSRTSQGITATVNSDGSVTVNGTATGTFIFGLDSSLTLNGNYILSGCPSGGSAGTYRMDCYWSGQGALIDSGSGIAISPNGNVITTRIVVFEGVTLNNVKFYPMIRLATETDPTWQPYSNICPITGHDEVRVFFGAEQGTADETYTTSLGQTVYGGTLDMVTGALTVDKAEYQLSDMTATLESNNRWFFTSLQSVIKIPSSTSVPTTTISDRFVAMSNVEMANTTNIGLSVNGQGNLIVRNGSSTDQPTGQIVIPLATPVEYQLTPQQIKTLVGTNNVWASSGDIVNIKFTYGGLFSELPSDATEIVGKCYCDVEQNGVSSMPFTLNVKKNERES